MGYRIGIDVGGTFTDYLFLDANGKTRAHKVLSTPDDPSRAVVQGLAELAEAEEQRLDGFLGQVDLVVHGTTVTTNAVLTGRTAKTGLLTTWGFRDALQMRRGVREAFYDNKFAAPAPLVPRRLRLPVRGRIAVDGSEIEPLSLDDVERAIEHFAAQRVEAVAICFLHAYANQEHEEAAARLVAQRLPSAYLSVSARVLPQLRYYERTSTTVLNAAVGPILRRYLDNLRRRLADAGFAGVLRVMQSNGGVTSAQAVAELAASTLLSGPAAAPTAGLAAIEPHRSDRFITVDMGGTSFDAALVIEGAPSITNSATVNRFALALPSMDIATIGAGGGSIGWIDHGLLRMGPASAGADPGPACYGRGGTQATCSDANLLLGYLSADFFAGGRLRLDAGAAREAIEREIAQPLAMDATRAAAGMYHVMNVNMASAIREISVQKGVDPREFPLVCAGGAGAIHAAMIARELGIARVLVPREASIFCASGMLRSDLKHDFVRSLALTLADGTDPAPLVALVDAMLDEASSALAAEGVAAERRRFVLSLDLRYLGQYHEVSVETGLDTVRGGHWAAVREAFHDRHDRLYGYALREEATPVELISLRVAAIGETDKPPQQREARSDPNAEHALKGRRTVWQPEADAFADTPVYDGEHLRCGNRIDGPAIVEKRTTTLFVPRGFQLEVDPLGGFLLEDLQEAVGLWTETQR
ncbi:MAG: hydantoinase/oxoprolinase family protein [Burkholderiaceae bacterium]|nr:hydantoinase/oxoprolinase family protein [Burkholderiaceae bacterium]